MTAINIELMPFGRSDAENLGPCEQHIWSVPCTGHCGPTVTSTMRADGSPLVQVYLPMGQLTPTEAEIFGAAVLSAAADARLRFRGTL